MCSFIEDFRATPGSSNGVPRRRGGRGHVRGAHHGLASTPRKARSCEARDTNGDSCDNRPATSAPEETNRILMDLNI